MTPEALEIVELLDEPFEVADAVAVRVAEGPHVNLVYDSVLVPAARCARDDRLAGRAPSRGLARVSWVAVLGAAPLVSKQVGGRHGETSPSLERRRAGCSSEKTWQGTPDGSSLTKFRPPSQE